MKTIFKITAIAIFLSYISIGAELAYSAQKVSFQFRATNSSGVPINGPISLEICYCIDATCSNIADPLKCSTFVVMAEEGLATVELDPVHDTLGGDPSTFPIPRYLRVILNNDTISPSFPINYSYYAIQATRMNGDIQTMPSQVYVRDTGNLSGPQILITSLPSSQEIQFLQFDGSSHDTVMRISPMGIMITDTLNDTTMLFTTEGGSARVGVNTGHPNSTLNVAGSLSTNVTIASFGATLGESHQVVLVSPFIGAATIMLPDATTVRGRHYTIKRISALNGVTVAACCGQTIDGAVSFPLSNQFDYVNVVSSGSAWYVVGGN